MCNFMYGQLQAKYSPVFKVIGLRPPPDLLWSVPSFTQTLDSFLSMLCYSGLIQVPFKVDNFKSSFLSTNSLGAVYDLMIKSKTQQSWNKAHKP